MTRKDYIRAAVTFITMVLLAVPIILTMLIAELFGDSLSLAGKVLDMLQIEDVPKHAWVLTERCAILGSWLSVFLYASLPYLILRA